MEKPVLKRKADKKVVILGDVDVGKTCLIRRYLEGTFTDGDHATIGAAFFLKQWNGKNIALWDTAGQEEFQGLTSFYCRQAHAVILCYDMCNRSTFDSIETRHSRLLETVADNCVMVFVGTKCDMVNKTNKKGEKFSRQVKYDEAMDISLEYIKRFSSLRHPLGILPIFETSSKSGDNVADVFEYIFETLTPDSVGKRTNSPSGMIELNKSHSNDNMRSSSKKCC